MLRTALAVASCAVPLCAQQWQTLDGPFQAEFGVVWDSARERTVAFGSEGETWEYEGTVRLHRSTPTAPFGRRHHAMVYDAARNRTLLFGGSSLTNVAFGDCWLWDGCTWQQPSFAVTPPRRNYAGIAFDSWRSRVVLFGGTDGLNAPLSDTWEYDGSQWLRSNPQTVPAPLIQPKLAFDSVRGVTVLVAADASLVAPRLFVFEWDGTNWTPRLSPTTPTSRTNFNLAYDPIRQRIVMCGGHTPGQLWEWDGTTWQSMLTSASLPAMAPGMYFDASLGKTVIAGGLTTETATAAWTWDGAALANLWPEHSPCARWGFACFQDDARNRSVLFGSTGFPERNDTWEWDGLRWTLRTPAVSPLPRGRAAACFDPTTGTGMLFGGSSGNANLADDWRWDGNNWTRLAGTVPSARNGATMAWDPVRREAILFGGQSTVWLADTWRWNGTGWTQAATAMAPSPRSGHALAFDPVRGRMVLFGGSANGTAPANYLNDTWEWDGIQWWQVATPQAPPVLVDPCLVHDPVRGRMLLVGIDFINVNMSQTALEAWEYDGTTWSLLCTGSVAGAANLRLVWDRQRQRAVLFDGKTVRELTSGPADTAVLGSGCGVPPPLLAARARPRTGENLFGLELATRPALPVLFALGFAPGSTPVGNGCTLLLQQVAATTFAFANGIGMAVQPIPLPANQALRGLVLYAQAGALDPAAPGGLALSPSLRLLVGD